MERWPARQAERLKHAQVIAALVVGRRQQLVAIEDAVGAREKAQRLCETSTMLVLWGLLNMAHALHADVGFSQFMLSRALTILLMQCCSSEIALVETL